METLDDLRAPIASDVEHLTDDQRAAIVTELRPAMQAELKERRHRAAKLTRNDGPNETDNTETPKDSHGGMTRAVLAQKAKVSTNKVRTAIEIQKADPVVLEQVKTGLMTLREAADRIRKQQATPKQPCTHLQRIEQKQQYIERIRELAALGWVAEQIAKELTLGVPRTRSLAREANIRLVSFRTRMIDANRIVEQTVMHAQTLMVGCDLIEDRIDQLDLLQVDNWIVGLREAIKNMNQLIQLLRRRLEAKSATQD